MENNLINMKGASKAFIALVDAVSRGIGVLYEPTHIKRVAKADAEAMLIRAEAEKKKETILAASEQQVGENVPNEELNAIVFICFSCLVSRFWSRFSSQSHNCIS